MLWRAAILSSLITIVGCGPEACAPAPPGPPGLRPVVNGPEEIVDDIDGDAQLNNDDDDLDGDGVDNTQDDDIDGDGAPNAGDDDVDGDGVTNEEDETPFGNATGEEGPQGDLDGDGEPNDIDNDDDGDGLPDGVAGVGSCDGINAAPGESE